MIAVNKSDGDNAVRARQAASEYRAALNIMAAKSARLDAAGGADLGASPTRASTPCGNRSRRIAPSSRRPAEHAERRRVQQVAWMWSMLEERVMQALRHDTRVAGRLTSLEAGVRDGTVSASLAVDEIAGALGI